MMQPTRISPLKIFVVLVYRNTKLYVTVLNVILGAIGHTFIQDAFVQYLQFNEQEKLRKYSATSIGTLSTN